MSVPEEVDIIDGQLYVEYNFMVHIEYIFLHMTNSWRRDVNNNSNIEREAKLEN